MNSHDIYLELDESILNESMAAVWQTGLASLKGVLSFAKDVPDALKPYAEVQWRVTLNGEPLIDFREPNHVYVRIDGKLELLILTMLPMTFDLAAHAVASIRLDVAESKVITPSDENNETDWGTLVYEVDEVIVDRLVLQSDAVVSDTFLDTLNKAVAVAIKSIMKGEEQKKALKVFSFNQFLPGIPKKPDNCLKISPSDAHIFNERRMGLGVQCFDQPLSDIAFTAPQSGSECFLRLRKDFIDKMYDFWWEKTDCIKPIPFEGAMNINANTLLEKASVWLTRIISLGFLQKNIELQNVKLWYKGTINLLDKPGINFEAPNNTSITNLKVKLDIAVRLTADVDERLIFDTSGPIPDAITPWDDDKEISHKKENREILNLTEEFEVDVNEAKASLIITPDGSVALKIMEAGLLFEFGEKWYQNLPENLLNGLVKFFNRSIIEKLPPLVLSPAIILRNVEAFGMHPEIIPDNILITEDCIDLGFSAGIRELTGKTHIPGYIANKRARRVHRLTCQVVKDIRPEHREGYFVLHEALRDGYTSCKGCLKGVCSI